AAGAEQAAELVLLALGALLLRLGSDRLKDFEFVLTGVAGVVVGGHISTDCSNDQWPSTNVQWPGRPFIGHSVIGHWDLREGPVETNTCAGLITRSWSL